MVLKTVVISISNKNVNWLLEPSYMVESGLSKFRDQLFRLLTTHFEEGKKVET
jgi:hypothetical protein